MMNQSFQVKVLFPTEELRREKRFDISQRHVGKNGYFSISTRENPNCGVVRLRRGFWSAGLREKQFIVRYSRVFIESADV